MRNWIDTVNVLNEGFFDSLMGRKAATPISAPAATPTARKEFGKRPAATVADPQRLNQAIDSVAQAIAWGGIEGAKEAIHQAAAEYGVPAIDIVRSITPEAIRNFQRRYD